MRRRKAVALGQHTRTFQNAAPYLSLRAATMSPEFHDRHFWLSNFRTKTRVRDGHLEPSFRQRKSPRLFARGFHFTGSRCVKESVPAAELECQTGADVVDHQLV